MYFRGSIIEFVTKTGLLVIMLEEKIGYDGA